MSAYREVLPPSASEVDWLSARRQGIGSSDIAAILGQTSWGSPYSVWTEKSGYPGDFPETESMYWGKQHEPLILAEWAKRQQRTIRTVGLCRNIDRPWQQATPDALCDCPGMGVVEAKTADKWDADEWADTVPIKYQLQILWQMDVLGADHGHVALLLGGNEFRSYDLAPDPEITTILRDRGQAFWTSVQNGTPPAVDGTDATTAALKRRWEPEPDSIVVLDPSWLARLDARKAVEDQIKTDTRDRVVLVANELREAMGEKTTAVAGGLQVATWKPDKNGTRVLRITDPAKRKELSPA